MPKPIGMCAQGLLHLCVLEGISAEYLPPVHGQALGHVPQTGENSWSRHTNMGDWLSAADRDVASPKPSVIFLHFVWSQLQPQGSGHGTVFTERAEPRFLGSSEHAKVKRRQKISAQRGRPLWK